MNKPALIASRRDVPTVVFKNTVDNDENTSSTVNVPKKIKSMENINTESIPYALITSALNDLKIQKKQDIKKCDIPEENNLKLEEKPKTTSLEQMMIPKLSDIDKEILTLLPDDPIYLIEFPEIIQDCTYKIPSPIVRKTKADLHFELYISEVHSPTQFWFQYGEEDLEELMNYMK